MIISVTNYQKLPVPNIFSLIRIFRTNHEFQEYLELQIRCIYLLHLHNQGNFITLIQTGEW